MAHIRYLDKRIYIFFNMKGVKIHITELGPIKDADIALAPLMLFTGESGLGKSYVNFLSYYVFDFFGNNGLKRFLSRKIEGKVWKENQLTFSFTISELRTWMAFDAKSFLGKLLAHPSINCAVDFHFREDIDDTINVVVRIPEAQKNEINSILTIQTIQIEINGIAGQTSRFLDKNDDEKVDVISRFVSQYLSRLILGNGFAFAFLMPPGRTSLIGNSFSVQKMVSNTGMYDKFLNDYDLLKLLPNRLDEGEQNNQFFLSQIRRLIHGTISTENSETLLVLPNGKKIPISAAASSVRELSPILLWIQNLSHLGDICSICLEEPEAHAHPSMQYGIADLIASCVKKGTFFQITTHSDYFLSRINQLIKLYKLQQTMPEEFDKSRFVSNKRQTINPADVKAYFFDYSEESGHVIIKEQDLEEGVPFDSFRKVIENQINFDSELAALTGDDDR